MMYSFPALRSHFQRTRGTAIFLQIVLMPLASTRGVFLFAGVLNLDLASRRVRKATWVGLRPDSDLDLAIIDPDYYHFLDREIRMWERNPENRAFRGPQFDKSIARQKQRGFYTYRYFDLPNIGCVSEHNARLKALPVEECCGLPRPIDAFIFRDWWSLYSRWEFDLRDLRKAGSATASSRVVTLREPSKTRTSDSLIGVELLAKGSRRKRWGQFKPRPFLLIFIVSSASIEPRILRSKVQLRPTCGAAVAPTNRATAADRTRPDTFDC